MAKRPTERQIELAHRAHAGIEVTLLWIQRDGEDSALVAVRDGRNDLSFEIPTEPYLALEVYHHPFAYRDFGRVVNQDNRFVEAVR